MKHIDKERPPMCFHALGQSLADSLHEEGHKVWKALSVIVLDERHYKYLRENDPKALEQALNALGLAKEL